MCQRLVLQTKAIRSRICELRIQRKIRFFKLGLVDFWISGYIPSFSHQSFPCFNNGGADEEEIHYKRRSEKHNQPGDLWIVMKREAETVPVRIRLSRVDLEWVHVLSEGWASPLRGFMRQSEFLQTLHFNLIRLEDGSVVNMSVPIVLAIDDEHQNRIGDSDRVTLVDSFGTPVAILSDIEIYKHPKEERIARTWGTTASGLPYAEEAITKSGNWLIGCDLQVLEPIKYDDGLDNVTSTKPCNKLIQLLSGNCLTGISIAWSKWK